MREQLEQRVSELKAEQEKGQRMLAEIDARQAELRQTLLRISGAIQVLDELLAGSGASQPGGADGAAPVAVNGHTGALAATGA
jgi:ABC-type transporter Mla subunit MlaD